MITRCPRCNRLLFADTDPDYGFCTQHGTLFLGTTLPPTTKQRETNPRLRETLPPVHRRVERLPVGESGQAVLDFVLLVGVVVVILSVGFLVVRW